MKVIKSSERGIPQSLFQIPVPVVDPRTKETIVFAFSHSRHSLVRAAQRGLREQKIAAALAYGVPYSKQGLVFYVLGEDQIPESLARQKDKLVNTVVVTDSNSDLVITCYRCSDPHRHIRRKRPTRVRDVA
ncbi:MAG: hypothetical protein EOO06_03330 [Chitinophagaceae bacterium]|nr:MAG: hypothetical protein EOO06_03330 [Chitinophagaceae bacterium]